MTLSPGSQGSPRGPIRRHREKSDRSLYNLTLQFRDMLKDAAPEPVELNDAANRLGVRKRRVYDITNVLEGIDLIVPVRRDVSAAERPWAALAAQVARLA